MAINSEIDNAAIHTTPIGQIGFYVVSVVFNLCLIAQLLTVGVAYFLNPAWWDIHVWLVRCYGGLSLLLLGWSFIVPFPRKIQRLTASLSILLGLQFLSIHLKSSLHLEILHPLIGFLLFYGSSSLVHSVWRYLSPNYPNNEQI